MMNTNILALAAELPDRDLLARLPGLADQERGATVELLAHLAALDLRPSLYAAEGHGSLFSYCTQVLRFSEDAACNRIHVARACRQFPEILELLATGALSLTAVRLLREHLTPENHEAVLARARGRSRRQIEVLVAELAPRPDVPSTVRKLPASVPRTLPTVEITPGPGAIFDRAVALLLDKVERQKLGATRRPPVIRPRTDNDAARKTASIERHPPTGETRSVVA